MDAFHEDNNALLFSRESLNLRRDSVSEALIITIINDNNVNEIIKEVRTSSAIVKGKGWHTPKEWCRVHALQKYLLVWNDGCEEGKGWRWRVDNFRIWQ